MEAAALIRSARTAAGLTQAQLAERLGTTQPEVARLESPRSNPRLETLSRAIAATGQRLRLAVEPSFGIDESLIAESLKASPAERLRQFEGFYRSAQKLGGKAFESGGP